MRNYVRLGPVHIKVSNRHLAKWGFPLIRIGGLSLFTWDNCGVFMPAAYHPRSSLTWLWSLSIYRGKAIRHFITAERGQRDFSLPFGWVLHYAWQKRMPWPPRGKPE